MSSEKTVDLQLRAIAAPWRSARRLGKRLATAKRSWVSHLADELGWGTVPVSGAGSSPDRSSLTMAVRIDSGNTDVLPAVVGDPRSDPSQTPAIPSPSPHRSTGTGRPDSPHGGTGDNPAKRLTINGSR